MAKQRKEGLLRVCVVFDRSIKANRDKYSGILRFASGRGGWEIRLLNPNDPHFERRCDDLFETWVPDAIIGGSNLDHARRLFSAKNPSSRPVVAYVDGPPKPQGADIIVRVDNAAIARCAAARLLSCGYRSYAYVGAHVHGEHLMSEERRRAFLAAFRKQECALESFVPTASDGAAGGDLDDLAAWLRTLEKPCGVMTYYDETAQLVFDACRQARIRIPEEVALVGVDNDLTICENMDPTLTSVLPDFEGAGYLAACELNAALSRRRRRKRPVVVEYGVKSLVERLSTQDTFKNGRLVSMAREFIRLHCHEGVCVRDVVAAVKVSPRILELRFRQIVRHSVSEEIQRQRIERLMESLRKTDRPTGELAYECGYRSQSNAPMIFRKRVGMSMTEYRSQFRRRDVS